MYYCRETRLSLPTTPQREALAEEKNFLQLLHKRSQQPTGPNQLFLEMTETETQLQ